MAEKKKWIKKAIKPENKGKFKEEAEKAGKSTAQFAKEHEGDSSKLGKQARLAETLMKLRKSKHDENVYKKLYK